jgi:hypothetical protein
LYSLADLKNIYDNQQLLIILIARLYFKKAVKEDIEQFTRDNEIDPKKLCRLARVHGISPFLYHVIITNNIEVPPQALQVLKQRYIDNNARCMEQLSISSDLQRTLSDKNITVIPYKGVGFSYNYYGDIGLRESSDMDFIIDERDADAIEQHLLDIGFSPKTTVPVAYRKYYRRNFKDISYSAPARTKATGFSAEMHWRLLNAHYGGYVRYDFFKQGLQKQAISGLAFFSLKPHYDFLAVASNHFVKDLATRFKYIIDIACLLHTQGKEIDQASFRSVIQQYGFEKRMEHGLFLVEALLGEQLSHFDYKNKFSGKDLCNTLEYRLVKIKISGAAFLKQSLRLQDNNFAKCRFLLRCIYYYTLPLASDIPKDSSYPIPFLAVMRLFRSARKVVQRSFGRRKTVATVPPS